MAFHALKLYTGDGVTTDFLFDDPYITQSDVVAYVGNVLTAVTYPDSLTVRISPAPLLDVPVKIVRESSRTTARFTYPDPTYLKSENLDGNQEQALFLVQELEDFHEEQGDIAGSIAEAEAAAAASAVSAAESEASSVTSSGFADDSEASSVTSDGFATASAASAAAAQLAADSLIWNDVVFKATADSPINLENADRGILYVIDSSAGAVTINLPSVALVDMPFSVGIKKSSSDSNLITVNSDGTDTIDGSLTKEILAEGSGATLVADVDPVPDEWTAMNFGASTGNLTVDNFDDGVDYTSGTSTQITLTAAPGSENNTQIYFDGLIQHHDQYSILGLVVTFTSAIPLGVNAIEARTGTTLTIGIPADASVTTPKIDDAAVTTIKLADELITPAKLSPSTYQSLGRRNVMINGSFNVWQRGLSFIAPTSGQYITDRWQQGNSTSAVYTIGQSSDIPPVMAGGYSLEVDVTTADTSVVAAENMSLQYKVEGYDYVYLAGRNATLSFWVKSTIPGAYSVGFRNNGADRTYVTEYTIDAADTWQEITVTIPLTDTAGSWNYTALIGLQLFFALAAGVDRQAPLTTWANTLGFASPNQVNALSSTANAFKLARVQLEPGDVQTPYEFTTYSDELARCQRYFETSDGHTSTFENAPARTSTRDVRYVGYQTFKRAGIPSIVVRDGSAVPGTSGKVSIFNTVSATQSHGIAMILGSRTKAGFYVSKNQAVTSYGLIFGWTADSEL